MPRAKKTPTLPYNTGSPAPVTPEPAPPSAPTGLGYGENQASLESQTAAPMAGSGPRVPGATPAEAMGSVKQGAAAMAFPGGGAGLLTGPSSRPWEPSTAGLPVGPGAGVESLGVPVPVSRRASDTIAELAELIGAPALRDLADRARARGQ